MDIIIDNVFIYSIFFAHTLTITITLSDWPGFAYILNPPGERSWKTSWLMHEP